MARAPLPARYECTVDKSGGGRLRSVAAGIIGVLAVILLLVSAIAVWARATLFDSDRVAAIAGDALAQPEVSQALADRVTEEVFRAVDVDSLVDDVLPSQLDRLTPIVAGGLEDVVDRALIRVFENPDVQELLTNLVRRAHAAAMRLLQGDGLVDGISVVDGAVTLNLLPLVERGLDQLQSFGLLTNVDLPTLSADGDPAQQVAELEQALGRDLPDDFGQLVVYHSERLADAQASLESAQQLLVVAKRALLVLLIATVVFLALTIVLARDRWRAALLLGLGAVAAMVIARTLVRRVRDDAPELVTRPGAKAAITSILDDAAGSLLRTFGLVMLVAVIVGGIAFFLRRRQRADLLLIGAVLAGAAFLALVGFSIWALLVAIAVGVLVYFGVQRLWPAQPAVPAATA
jgi:hypothetical protein